MGCCIMSLGAYDEDEHERRAQKTGVVDAEFDDTRSEYRGEIQVDAGDSAEALLDQFREINDQ